MKPLSFTSSSEAAITSSPVTDRAGYLRIARKLAVFLIACAMLEAFSYLFVPPLHPLQEVSEKKPAMLQAALDSDAHYDTFFVGSSLTEEGLDPNAFAQVWGGTAFNAGLAGSANVTFASQMIQSIIEKKKPSLIVYGIEHFAFDRGVKEQDTQMFRFLNLYRQRTQIKRWIGRIVRGRFERPPAFWDARAHVADFDKRFSKFDSAVLHDNGWVEVHALASMTGATEDPFPGPFRKEPVQVMAIDSIKKLSRETGVPVIFVQFPQSNTAIAASKQRFPGFDDFMRSDVSNDGFIYLNFNSTLPFPRGDASLYYDGAHLNSEGAKLFAPLLAAEIAKYCHHDGARIVCDKASN
ncbi:hypothetical protein [Labrys miyagiensis]|nr:hypothetical protein [Labrys miyagiensis]